MAFAEARGNRNPRPASAHCHTFFFFFFFFFACSADHERDWPPYKVVFLGLATNALNVRNNNDNNNALYL